MITADRLTRRYRLWDPTQALAYEFAGFTSNAPYWFVCGADAKYVAMARVGGGLVRLRDLESESWLEQMQAVPLTRVDHATLSADHAMLVVSGLDERGGQTIYRILVYGLPPPADRG